MQTLPEFETSDIRIRDVCARAQIGGNFKRSYNQKPGRKPKLKPNEPPALAPLTSAGGISNAFKQTREQSKAPKISTTTTNQSQQFNKTSNSYHNQSAMDIYEQMDALNASENYHHIMDNDYDVQEEVVSYVSADSEETPSARHSFADEGIPAFLIANDAASKQDNALHISNESRNNNQQLPKLEPIASKKDLNRTASKQPYMKGSSSLPYNSSTTTPELIQETHACYFSLIRDFFCATSHHRMCYADLKQKIDIWLNNPITALNDWYPQAASWSALLQSAINFLAGDFLNLPHEYVPYIEHKTNLNIYQWIGAGRDSDARLSALCNYWMQRKNDHNISKTTAAVKTVSTAASAASMSYSMPKPTEEHMQIDNIVAPPTPPPRCPTNWTVRPATPNEIEEFRRQERARFEQPHKAYTYKMFGYESVVGPVKGIYTQMLGLAKARGHSMMVADRPNFVTILTLVRDATARLPNGEGTRADISELLKCSQYINPEAAENVLQTIVSGALDRMHTEVDPCVRYDPKRKIWIYLHRNRTEADFERMHQQQRNALTANVVNNQHPQFGKKPFNATTINTGSNSAALIARKSAIKINKPDEIYNQKFVTVPALVPSNNNNNNAAQQISPTAAQKCPPVPPLKYNIPNQQQQKSLLKARQDALKANEQQKMLITQRGSNKLANKPANSTPIVVQTPSGLQTVHVPNASNNDIPYIPDPVPLTSATLCGRKVALHKPIIINQISSKPSPKNRLLTQQQQQGFVMPNKQLPQASNQTQQRSIQIVGQQGNAIRLVSSSQVNAATLKTATAGNTNVSNNKAQVQILGQRLITSKPLAASSASSSSSISSSSTSTTASNLVNSVKALSGITIIPSSSHISSSTTSTTTTSTPVGSVVKMSAQAFAALQQKQAAAGGGGQQQLILKSANSSGTNQTQQQRVLVGEFILIM